MIWANNAFVDYLEQNSDLDRWLEIVESKLIEIFNLLKAQISQSVIWPNNNLDS